MKFYRFILFSLLLCFVFPLLSNADQIEDAKKAIQDEDFIKAKRILSPLAEDGNADAQSMLGALYANGQGVDKDLTKGLSWIMKAATQGHEVARMNAFTLCLDLGKKGDPKAMFNVAYMCLNGWGGEQDTDSCLGWMETAARMNHVKSSETLAKIYTKGLYGVTPDEEKAAYWSNLPSAFDAGIDGKWEGSTAPGSNGPPAKVTYEFKTDGDNLTGTVIGYDGDANQIKDGKIQGNNFSFTVDSKLFGRNSTDKYTGIFMGDTLKITKTIEMDRQRGSGFKTSATATAVGAPQTFTTKRIE